MIQPLQVEDDLRVPRLLGYGKDVGIDSRALHPLRDWLYHSQLDKVLDSQKSGEVLVRTRRPTYLDELVLRQGSEL